jgi:hypothetical protein
MENLKRQSSEWARRLHSELESRGYLDVLAKVGRRREVYPTPLQLDRIFGIIDRVLNPTEIRLIPRGNRVGGTAIARAISSALEKMTMGDADDDRDSVASSIGSPDPLEDFRDNLRAAFGRISDKAYDNFVRRLRDNWAESMDARMAVASSSSTRRDSAA